jgi:hypothetical protein
MNVWQKISYIVMMALFAGVTSAAPSAVVPGVSAADTPSQSAEPADCKKKPDDPRCKDKPY